MSFHVVYCRRGQAPDAGNIRVYTHPIGLQKLLAVRKMVSINMRPGEVFVAAVKVDHPMNLTSSEGIIQLLAAGNTAEHKSGEHGHSGNVAETVLTADSLFPKVVWPEDQMLKLPKGSYCNGSVELKEDYELFPLTHSFWMQFNERYPRLEPFRDREGEPVRDLSLYRLAGWSGMIHVINRFSKPYGTLVKTPSLSLIRALLSAGDNVAFLKKMGITSLLTASCVTQRETTGFLTVAVTGGAAQAQSKASPEINIEQYVNAKIFLGRSKYELRSETFAVLDMQDPERVKVVPEYTGYPGVSVLLERAPFITSRSVPFYDIRGYYRSGQ